MFNGNILPHELLSTIRQKTKLQNTFEDNMSTNIKLSKTQISKIIQSRGFLDSLLSKLACSLMKVAVQMAKNILVPLERTAGASPIHAGIQRKIHGSGCLSGSPSRRTTLIISNEKMDDTMKIFQVL